MKLKQGAVRSRSKANQAPWTTLPRWLDDDLCFNILQDNGILMKSSQLMFGRQSGDRRLNDGRYPASFCRRYFDKMSLPDRLTIVG